MATMHVVKNVITHEKVDVIVNPTNGKLLPRGVLSENILRCAGRGLVRWEKIRRHVQENGELP